MMQPIRDNILVKPFPPDEVTAGGILISEAHRPVNNKMKVIAVGKGTKKEPMLFNPGDTVFRVQGGGDEIEIEGEQYFIVKQAWLLCKMN